MLAGLVNSETSLCGLQVAAVLLFPHMASGVSSTSYDSGPIGSQSDSFNLIEPYWLMALCPLLKGPLSKYSHIVG